MMDAASRRDDARAGLVVGFASRKSVGRKRGLSAAALAALKEEHARTIAPARALAIDALALERKLSDLVNAAYGLTPAEIALMWQTAPPRTPLASG